MRKRLVLVTGVLVALSMFGAACSSSSNDSAEPTTTEPSPEATTSAAGDIAKGEKLYASTCAACHGADLQGVTNLGKPLADSAFVKDTSDQALVVFVTEGRPASSSDSTTGVDMPPKGGNAALTEAQIQDIVAFLKSKN